MRNFKIFAAASGLVMALAACEQEREVVTPEPVETEVATTTADVDPLARDYTLSPEAQERRASFDLDEFQTEFRTLREETTNASGTSATGSTATGIGSATSGTTAASGSGGIPRDRSAMNWEYLDRNSDGQLSVAEYAIWAIPLDPNEPKPDDETKPYVTAEQANRAADSFFYFDRDGDTYLSQSEFASARSGASVG
ncbi:EF-hand domain-containing protein [Allopontixanthobacter sp.]|uniref:EF-hand domain-containing protein n=1 Tax=Allopontixanthobacter sp. TaxID=2906452 RepID=UPI002AB9E1D1|nr:EF-hand domain-containing protein [Allopontixanthobacter sp.]MDZ4308010.1 EF-hand domain-containing protein [Allopontixanthobacter sp.]